MEELLRITYPVTAADYTSAGKASTDIKRRLKQLGVGVHFDENNLYTLLAAIILRMKQKMCKSCKTRQATTLLKPKPQLKRQKTLKIPTRIFPFA